MCGKIYIGCNVLQIGLSYMSDYVAIKIPKEIVDKMDIVISKRLCGYRSRAEIACEGIRIIMSSIVENQHKLIGDES
jgi:hypothetical protein